MNRANSRRVAAPHGVQGVFVFLLLGIFAVMSTLLVLLGAQMYRATVERSAENNRGRVLGAYVRSMVRSGDAKGAVTAEVYDAFPADALPEGAADMSEDDDDLVDFGDGLGGLVDFGDDDGLVDFADESDDGPVNPGDTDDGLVDLGDEPNGGPADPGDAGVSNDGNALVWLRRAADAGRPEGAVSSVNAIALSEEIDGETYVTLIYPYEGQLREHFARSGYAFRPGDGTAVCDAAAMGASISDGLMTVRLVDGAGNLSTVQVALRCGDSD